MANSGRRGFTLIEVLVALVLSGVVAVGVHEVFVTIASAGSRIVSSGERSDRDANADRLLRDLVRNIDSDGTPATAFEGDSTVVSFGSWCASTRGWLERCRVTLALEMEVSSQSLVATLPPSGTLTILRFPSAANFAYLTDLASGGLWARAWKSKTLVPRAIGVISANDTLVIRVGDRS